MVEKKAEDRVLEDMRAIFPGREVEVKTETGDGIVTLKWRVFPPGVNQINEHSALMARVTEAFANGADLTEGSAWIGLVPFIMRNVFGLVEECVEQTHGPKLSLGKWPHYIVAPVVETWILESFGSEAKLRPWIAAIENLVERATGKSLSLWEKLSSISLPQDTTEETSST